MKIAIIQAPLVWEDAEANRNYFTDKINGIKADLVLLPEMFSTGFTMKPETVAESMSGETVLWMQSMAISNNMAIAGSIVIKENGHFYNRMLFVRPTGTIESYDKRHLFTLAGEDKAYTAGTGKLIVDYQGWKICILICYDLRFPVFSRNTDNYDMLVYAANWPKPRIHAWDTLLRARAIENMSCVIGVNRIGQDSNGHEYVGHSQMIDALGNYIIAPQQDEGVFIAEPDRQELIDARNKFAFLDDRDRFTVLPD
jgi:omega-amidase